MSKRGFSLLGLVVALAVAGCASEDWEKKYEEQQKLNLDLAAQNDDTKQGRAEAVAKAEQYAQQLKQSDIAAQKAQQAAEALAKQNEELRKMAVSSTAPKTEAASPAPVSASADLAQLRELVAQIKKELGKGATEVGVSKEGNIEITLASDVNFGSGSAELSDAGKKSVKSLGPILKGKFAPYPIRVEGHTDSTPLKHTAEKYKDNFGLGSARSLSVVRFLESELSIEPTRLMSASRGEHDPIADDKTDAGKKRNRRVDVIVIIPHDAALSMAK